MLQKDINTGFPENSNNWGGSTGGSFQGRIAPNGSRKPHGNLGGFAEFVSIDVDGEEVRYDEYVDGVKRNYAYDSLHVPQKKHPDVKDLAGECRFLSGSNRTKWEYNCLTVYINRRPSGGLPVVARRSPIAPRS